MSHITKLFRNGRSQAVRLSAAYRFDDCEEVYVRRDPETEDVILSRKPNDWDSFIAARDAVLAAGEVPDDFPLDPMNKTSPTKLRPLREMAGMKRYTLDTNIVSHAVKDHVAVRERLGPVDVWA
jgi:antitoxin VapB